jgi:SAM-dependent methyltransferase
MRARIRSLARLAYGMSRTYGFDPRAFYRALRATPKYVGDYVRYRNRARQTVGLPAIKAFSPALTEASEGAGVAHGHYFHQDLWAARKIYANRPKTHVDVGSRIDGFIAHVLVFMPVTVVDIRPLESTIDGLEFRQADATRLEDWPDGSVESISSLHALEHFGLGRYGDEIDPTACFDAMRNIARVVAPGGRFYFSAPIGRERIEFNAHRIFSPVRLLDRFPGLELASFAAVDDDGAFVADARPEDFVSAFYSCGLYEFRRPV